jgi:tRNA threonylcarbamoyladenosine biosynthesis protein TsaB
MRVLAIETVGTTGSVALLQGDAVVAESVLDPAQRSAQSLAPAIDELLRRHGWQPAQVELVAVATGPGSFTGLRIGVATAKMFAYAVGCPILGVDTMSAIAWRVPRGVERFSVVVDAQRGALFVADFERTADGGLWDHDTTRIVDAAQWIAELEGGHVVTGPGLARWSARVEQAGAAPLAPTLWAPTASAVGQIAVRDFLAGRRASPFELVPQYVRRAAAEERRQPKAEN